LAAALQHSRTGIDEREHPAMDEAQLRQRVAEARVARDPRATVLVDAYDEDWSTVWWVRLRGRAVTDPEERARARRLLWDKYPQFGDAPPEEAAGPVMAVDIEQWAGWAYSP
jgi:hypothetical protein